MTRSRHVLLRALAICGIAVPLALAATQPSYDFTGHWDGTATVPQHHQLVTLTLSGDFTSTGTNTFSGTITAAPIETNCTVTGRLTRKVKMRLTCPDGSKPKLKGHLDTTAGSITGAVTVISGHGKLKHGTFMLTKAGG
jgi:hypothetical protein